MKPLAGCILFGTVILAGAAAVAQSGTSLNPHAPPAEESIVEKTKRIINNPDPKVAAALRAAGAREKVIIKSFTWSGNGIGVMTARFTFENNSDFDVKDPTLMCDFEAASGTMVGATKIQTIFMKLPKKRSTASPKINFGFIHQQASSARCRVSDVALLSP